MRNFWLLSLFALFGCVSSEPYAEVSTELVYHTNFERMPIGVLSEKTMLTQLPRLKWTEPYDRVIHVERDGQHFLRLLYPKGAVGPHQGGAQFLIDLPKRQEYILTYSVYFEPGFDFRLGGKLPGMTSGGEKWSGGNRPLDGEGWSARLMWRENGQAELYLYYMDMTGQWGDSIEFKNYFFKPGLTYHVKERIKVNDVNKNNAEIQVWINDVQVLDMADFRLRKDEERGLIDSVYFSTFHGGNTPEWGPTEDTAALFSDLKVYSSTPQK